MTVPGLHSIEVSAVADGPASAAGRSGAEPDVSNDDNCDDDDSSDDEDSGERGPIWRGVANLGLRPTFDGVEPRLEVHLFDVNQDLYGRTLIVEMIAFLRSERKFSGLEELKAQILRDSEEAKRRLAEG